VEFKYTWMSHVAHRDTPGAGACRQGLQGMWGGCRVSGLGLRFKQTLK